MASIINCSNTESNGLSELNEIRNSLAAGGTTIVNGICHLPANSTETLTITNAWGASVDAPGKVILQGGCFRNLIGIDIVDSRRVAILDIEHYPQQYGIRKRGNSIMVDICRNYINCTDNAIVLDTVAATNVVENYLSNWQGQTGQALVIGQGSNGYESAMILNNRITKFGNCIRIGGTGNMLNTRFSGNQTDRPGWFHYIVEPHGTASARNIIIDQPWMNGGQYGIALSSNETTGVVGVLDIIGGQALGIPRQPVTVMGDPARVSYRSIGGFNIGPLEPG